VIAVDEKKQKKVRCPYCGYELPIFYSSKSEARDIYTVCKGRNCKKKFKITLVK
jgi:hypothetical protein